jgi:hypothetical protein
LSLVVFLKQGCETCKLVAPILESFLKKNSAEILCQDGSSFAHGLEVREDLGLQRSWEASIEIVPTLISFGEDGIELDRIEGWNSEEWAEFLEIEIPETMVKYKPGCGSDTLAPGMPEKLAAKYGDKVIKSRDISLAEHEDEIEACYSRGWSDGLPVVPPTKERVLRMLSGTTRHPQDIIGVIPPNLVECSVEKIAINAVLAGCLPQYLPVVIAAVEAALQDEFCMHGLLATTYFSGPLIIVNGPIAREIGMNSQGNVLGQGNRANSTIGRALQLVVRNIGGGKPQEIDRSAFGTPGKVGFCFAEDEAGSYWQSLAEERGIEPGCSSVTLFAADGVQAVVDQKSRDPESLSRTFAAGLRSVGHPKLVLASDAILVVSPEHERVFRLAGWTKDDLKNRLKDLLTLSGDELIEGANGITEGIPLRFKDKQIPKFRDGGLLIVRAGGKAGLFSAIIAGWGASGKTGSAPVTRKI